MLLISGTGRKSGKTTLACQILKKFATIRSIIGLKISSHFHKPGQGLFVVKATDNYIIYEEKNRSSSKDSSRMLEAGAVKSFYIQSNSDGLNSAIIFFMNNLSNDLPIVCESSTLSSVVTPGLYIITQKDDVNNPIQKVPEGIGIADKRLLFNGSFDDQEISSINLHGNRWILSFPRDNSL
jgi:hypothetical protein